MSFISDSDTVTITVNTTPVQAICGPVNHTANEYDGGVEYSRKIIADVGDLPVLVGQSVDIDGDDWQVAKSLILGGTVSVTFTRAGGR